MFKYWKLSVECVTTFDKYVGSPYGRAEMYADRVTCCPLASHVEYAYGKDTAGQTDGRQTVTLCFLIGAVSVGQKLLERGWCITPVYHR